MDEEDIIQNTEKIQGTHNFIHKSKSFPFNFYMFLASSEFFQNRKEQLEHLKNIPLIENEDEEKLDFSNDSIENFIKYVHHENISINKKNAAMINYLAKKYKISSLIKYTKQYISKHIQDISLPILTIEQNFPSPETEIYEETISEHLKEYINDERLLSFNVPLMHRILTKYQHKFPQASESKEIIDFLMKYLDKHKRKASVLFSNVDFGDARAEYLHRLITDYKNDFDFYFVNPALVQTLYENLNQQSLQQLQLKEMRDEIDQLKSLLTQQMNEQSTQKNEFEKMRKIVCEQKSQIDSLVQKQNEDKIEIDKQANKIESDLLNSINQIKNEVKQIQNIQKCLLIKPKSNFVFDDNIKYWIPTGKEWDGSDKYFELSENKSYKVTSSTTFGDGHVAKNLFDGKNEIGGKFNVWASIQNELNAWIQIELPNPVISDVIKMTSRNGFHQQTPTHFELFGMNDQGHEESLAEIEVSWENDQTKLFPFLNNKPYSKYKFYFYKFNEFAGIAALNLGKCS